MELMPSYGTREVRFSVFEVDLRAGELRRNGVKVKIQNQPFQILAMLLERPGEIITRDEMQARLWPAETFVDFDHGLNSAIRRLRDALGDSAESPTFVETLGRRGYRFVFPVEKLAEERPNRGEGHGNPGLAEVVPISGPEPDPPQPSPVARHWKLKAALAFLGAMVLASAVLLSNDNSYLSRTRLGETARHLALKDRVMTPPAVTQRRLTANPEDTPVTSGVISPDGKYLAYTDSTGFYLRQVDNGETHPVPLPKGFDAVAESWFPDNLHLVVSRIEDPMKPPSLWKISIFGGTPRKLADVGSSASVSPDGSYIVFLTGMWDHEEIWQVEADGGSARRLLNGDQDDFGTVAWAPDGKRFAYVRMINRPGSDEPEKQIEVYEPASGGRSVILSQPRLGIEVAWMTTGRLIYSLQEVPPNQDDFNLWWVQLDAHTGRPSSSPARITNDRAQTAGISATSDGKRVALVRRSFQADVYLADVEAQGKRLSTPRRFTLDERQDFPAAWTEDSKAVLFVSDRDGPLHIFKQDIDQTQPELVVGGKQDEWLPRLTPDGSSMLYLVSGTRDEPADNTRLMRIPVSGGPSQLVLEGPGIMNYQCAKLPSALCIYGQMDAESYRFFAFDPLGGKGTELLAAKTKRENGPNSWNLSPDGKYLVTRPSQDPYKGPELRILSLHDNATTDIPVPELKLIIGIDWATDSKSLWVGGYNGRGSWGTRSGLVNVDLTGKVRTLLEGRNPEVMGGTPSPDGRRLALGVNTVSSNVWLLENF
jgi:Tol biopolymer transport system component/DNA-binding winged helix-turn-helix (wHTH) protein